MKKELGEIEWLLFAYVQMRGQTTVRAGKLTLIKVADDRLGSTEEVKTAEGLTEAELISLTLQYGDKGTIRRMGTLLERERVARPLLGKLERALPPSTSLLPWIPTYPKRGTVNRGSATAR